MLSIFIQFFQWKVLKPLLNECMDDDTHNNSLSCKFKIKTFIQGLLEAGNQVTLAKAVQDSPEICALFSPNELDQLCGKNTDVSIPALLSSTSWELPDLGPRSKYISIVQYMHYQLSVQLLPKIFFFFFSFLENPRLEINALEEQLIQSYDSEDIRQLLSKISSLPTLSERKPIWNVNSKVCKTKI